jgi:uncharacterized protein
VSDGPADGYRPDPGNALPFPPFSAELPEPVPAPYPPAGVLPAAPPSMPAPREPSIPAEPVAYPQLLRGPYRRWWKPLLSGLVLVGLMIPLVALAVGVTTVFAVVSRVPDLDLWLDEQLFGTGVGPGAFLFGDLTLIAFIPAVLLSTWIVHRVRPGFVSSVVGRIRWRWLLRSAAVLTPLLLIYLAISFTVEPPQGARPSDWIVLLVLVLLLTPFQAAAEEYLFRGWVPQQLGVWLPWPRICLVVATTVSAIAFALLHGSTDSWILTDLLVFAVAASIMTWRTGGLESAIALHAVNNLAIGVLVLTFGGWDESFVGAETAGSPVSAAAAVALQAAAVALVWWQARRVGVQRLFAPQPPPVSNSAVRPGSS